MSLTHEFGIIENFAEISYEAYAPQKNQCISVEDAIVVDMLQPLLLMQTYFHSLDSTGFGLAYHGITIIPPESLSTFLDIVLSRKKFKQHDNAIKLSQKIIQAKNENKYMIHYGV